MDEERKSIMRVLAEPRVELEVILKSWYNVRKKRSSDSVKARQDGDELYFYKYKNHDPTIHEVIWKFYSQSIANAHPNSEELALSYDRRSALFLHLLKFEDSISDINKALKITMSFELSKRLHLKLKICNAEIEKIRNTFLLQNNSAEEAVAKDQNKKEIVNTIVIDKTKDLLQSEEELSENFSNMVSVESFNFSQYIKEDQSKIEKILFEKKSANPFGSVYIQYSKKYGRHLMANRDIKPGEIIMVVNPYVRCINLNNMHTSCSHCLKTTWASIPCDSCNLNMFCSKNCKEEAWKEYHEIECPVISHIISNQSTDYSKQLALRLTIIAIRKAGSIAKLKEELSLIDKCNLNQDFSSWKSYTDDFKRLYSLSSNVSSFVLDYHIDHAVLILTVLAKATSLFDKEFNSKEDLLSNEDVIFVGSLLLKLTKICDINAHCVINGSSSCRFLKSIEKCYEDRCCERGACIALLPSFINHSCNPNVRKCFTEDMYLMIYALQPIKKDTQLFDSYVGSYFQTPKDARELLLKKFNFTCDCIPCKYNWPQLLIQEGKDNSNKKNLDLELELSKKYKTLFESTRNSKTHYCLSTLDYLSTDIERAITELEQPSHIITLLISTLWTVFDYIYSFKLQVPDKCDNY